MSQELKSTLIREIWNKDAISIEGLNLSIGSKNLITNATFTIPANSQIALLGKNGCGKSSLFHWLSREHDQKIWSIYEVAQELEATNLSLTVISIVLASHIEKGKLWARQAELDNKEELTDLELEEYNEIGEKLLAMKADEDESRARKILFGLGLSTTQVNGPISHLSGGWRSRVALAQGLFMQPDLLLLDEPTNHLDLDGVVWLQDYISKWPKTIIVISHNAGFIREISKTIWLIDKNKLTVYHCKYDRYRKLRAEEDKKQDKAWTALEKQILQLKKKGKPAEATALITKGEKNGITRPDKKYAPKFFFLEESTSASTSSSKIGSLISTDNAILGYNQTIVLKHVSFALHPGCRIALVGANGSGKSTLLKFLSGELTALNDTDTTVQRRPGLVVCTFDQHFYHTLPDELSPLDYLKRVAPKVGVDLLRKVLGATGLEGVTHTRAISTLSGGQKARVYFASISAQAPDILLMDEPTNHLDMETVAGLQDGLKDFPGASIIVSHDIDFLESVATEVWCVEDQKVIRLSEGNEGLEIYVNKVLNAIV